jgi:uncharacterized protein YdaU (DUF1376 family)
MADVRVLDTKTGKERTFTRASWNFQKSSGRFKLIDANYETEYTPVKKKEPVADVAESKEAEEGNKQALRSQYFDLSGEEADGRWSEKRLEEEITKLK